MFFKMMSGEGNRTCTFSCPGGSVPVPRPGHVPSSNGCGSMGITLDTRHFPGFNSCCDKHDKCYDTCNNDRDKCDEAFEDCIDNVCDEAKLTQSADRVAFCVNAAGVMQTAARGLGCNSFKDSQKKACVCQGDAIVGETQDEESENEEAENGELENGGEDEKMMEPSEIDDEDFDKVEL